MKAISIRQPWAWLILNAGKDIENRRWRSSLRGRVLVHAAKGMTRNEYDEAEYESQLAMGQQDRPLAVLPRFEDLERGGVVGAVDIVDCVDYSPSPWFCGPHGFVLANPERIPFRPVRGALGFFDVEVMP